MRKKIRDLFYIWQGHQITDEEIYNSEGGEYPILTGQNQIKGFTKKPFIKDVPCITIPSKGIVNTLYIQKKPFDANNTIALIPKDRKEIYLDYVVFTKSKEITSYISSVNTNNYLNKDILADIEINYPEDIEVQKEMSRQYQNLLEMKKQLESIEKVIENQLAKIVLYNQ